MSNYSFYFVLDSVYPKECEDIMDYGITEFIKNNKCYAIDAFDEWSRKKLEILGIEAVTSESILSDNSVVIAGNKAALEEFGKGKIRIGCSIYADADKEILDVATHAVYSEVTLCQFLKQL